MSQQGTPFGAVTALNQARMSGETLSYCPLSKASAVPLSVHTQANRANCRIPRMRSSTACLLFAIACQRERTIRRWTRLGLSRDGVARSKIERSALPGFGAMQNLRVQRHEWRRLVLVAMAAAAVRFSTPSLA